MTLEALKEPATEAVDRETCLVVEDLLYRQSDALDRKQWQDFIDLFDEDGVYWIPAEAHHTTWERMPSICTENKDLMAVRRKRLEHPHAWSQQTAWGTNHVVGNIRIGRATPDSHEIVAYSRFQMMEYRLDDVRHFGGAYQHHLVPTDDGYRIRLQRVDLVNAAGPYEYVLQAWV